MELIRIIKKTKSKIEQAKALLSVFCVLSDIRLSKTELTVLAYFLVYGMGESTKKLILSSQILKSEDSLKNTMSKLKKAQLIRKSDTTKEYLLSEKIKVSSEPVIGILVKIDNT